MSQTVNKVVFWLQYKNHCNCIIAKKKIEAEDGSRNWAMSNFLEVIIGHQNK
jgi:hypothetical protein